jgi:hypothetical protein
MSVQSEIPGTLANWTYTTDEWRAFMKWSRKRKGFLYFLFYFSFFQKNKRTHRVVIAKDCVVIDNKQEFFANMERNLKRVNIKDAGAYNVMEIIYASKDTSTGLIHEIYIPIPKGKLREAIEVQEKIAAQLLPG